MTALPIENYEEQRPALSRAIELAEAELHSVTFKKSTGAANAADVKAAKEHLAKLREDLEDLEAAWSGAATAAEADRRNQAGADFNAYLAETDRLLAARVDAAKLVADALDHIRAGVTAYREATVAIRMGAKPFHRNVGVASQDYQFRLNEALAFDVATTLVAAMCGELNIPHITHAEHPFYGSTPEEFEAKKADKIRIAARGFAPKFEDAV